MSNKDTLIVCLSDMHSGSTTALFPHYKQLNKGYWQFKHSRYVPSGRQCDMFEHFIQCALYIAKNRKNKRIVIVHDGDAIDGKHHHTNQIVSGIEDEHIDVHIWLMQYFMKKAGFDKQRGDLLYYVTGTEVHVNDQEDRIARELGAEQTPSGQDAFDFLPLEINNRLFWFLHHGAGAGKGYTEGDALRNWLKKIYWARKGEGKRIPDFVISGHYHIPAYSSYIHDWKTIHGMILPSWQTKTRFGYRVAPTDVNKIGMSIIDVSASGDIAVPRPLIMQLEDTQVTV